MKLNYFRRGLILGAFLGTLALAMFAQSGITYTQTTHGCTMAGCADAQFVAPNGTVVTASWGVGMEYCGYKDVSMMITWNGVEYFDGLTSMHFIGPKYNGKNYYPWAVWESNGTFDNGTVTITEHVLTYRGCAGGKNLDGNAVVQPNSDTLVGGGTGGGGH